MLPALAGVCRQAAVFSLSRLAGPALSAQLPYSGHQSVRSLSHAGGLVCERLLRTGVYHVHVMCVLPSYALQAAS